jgi:hypothetical protein
MISCVWAILCEQSIINQETDSISLIEVIEEIVVPPPSGDETPFVLFNFSLVIYWKTQELFGEENEPRFRLRVVSPSKEVLLEGERNIDFLERPKTFTILRFTGFPVPESGLYEFQIQLPNYDEVTWENVQSVTLQVNYEQIENSLEDQTEL